MIVLKVENENPFQAGWLACHMGLPKDCLPELEGMARQSFDEGYRMREETANMQEADEYGHGACHIAFLMETEIPVGFVRHRVSVSEIHISVSK